MLHDIKALILDMDGVIWKSDLPIGDLPAIFGKIREHGLRFVFVTNNSTNTPERYVERLSHVGVDVEPWQIITSSQGAAHVLAKTFPAGSKIYMVGEDGIRRALEQKGFQVLSVENAGEAQAVVMGMDRGINFQKMVEAALLVRGGVPFYATNPDRTFPTPRGEIPGAGAWISVITTATEIQPVIAGKPLPFLMELALEALGTSGQETLVVGDRLDTDIAAAQAAGCPTGLVLSGISTRSEAESWQPPIDIIADDLSSLVQML
jgi:4-nitrophenyl phosphatase